MTTGAEAPVSQTMKFAYKDIEILITQRSLDEKIKPFLESSKVAIDWALENGFTIPPQRGGFPKKTVEYVEGRVCPQCGSKLVNATKKDGGKYIRCENNKWVNGAQQGCKFVEWPKSIANTIPERQVDEERHVEEGPAW